MDRFLATRYVARQPIFDGRRQLAGFELLFRDSTENHAPDCDPDLASKKTVDAAVLLGLDILSAGHRVFLNCSERFLLDGFTTLFPPELTVVEIVETVPPTAEVVRACRAFKRLGYSIALDDFVAQPGYEALVEVADIIKLDIRATSPEDWEPIAREYLAMGRQMLAEKVETEEEFQTTARLGFSLFQGYLLSKPSVLETASLNGLEVNRERILRILESPYLDLVEVENVIKSDPALFYRLLRFLRSPAFYLQSEIRSVLHALILLGTDEVRKWLQLVCSVEGDTKGRQRTALNAVLVRAKFVELIAREAHLATSEPFTLGLLSSFDSILGLPMSALADGIAVSEEVRAALAGAKNPLQRCLEMALAYERAEWEACEQMRKDCPVPNYTLSRAYNEATHWAEQISQDEHQAPYRAPGMLGTT